MLNFTNPYNQLENRRVLFPDLVNNYSEFHKIYGQKELIGLPSWTDNSDYSHLKSIFEINHVVQDKEKEIRYSKKIEFNDQIENE